MGYGSRSSLLGTMETKIIAITDNLKISHKDLLNKIKVDESGNVDVKELKAEFGAEAVDEKQLEALRAKLPELINTYKAEIYGDASSKKTAKS
jgi:hypothetical protein